MDFHGGPWEPEQFFVKLESFNSVALAKDPVVLVLVVLALASLLL